MGRIADSVKAFEAKIASTILSFDFSKTHYSVGGEPAFPLFMMKNKSTKNPRRTQLLQMWIFRGFFVDSFKKTEVEFWGFVDFSWIFRGFVGGFFVDSLKPCGFFMDSVGGFTLDLGWIYLDFLCGGNGRLG